MNEIVFLRIVFRKAIPWLLVLFYWANLYRKTDHSALPFMMLLGLLGFLGIIDLIKNRNINRHFISFFIFVYVSTGISNWGFIGNVAISDLIKDILFLGVTLELFASPIHYLNGIVSFYVSVFFFIDAFLSGAVTKELLSNASGNYISVLLILAESLYFIGLHNSNRKIMVLDFIPPILCMLLSIWAVGRSGILCSTFFLLLIAIVYYKQGRNRNKTIVRLFSLLFFLVLSYFMWESYVYIEDNNFLRKLEEQGLETPRLSMWKSYFEQMLGSPIYFIFGVPFDQVHVIHSFDDNTHNSFLQLHASNGLMFFMTIYLLFRTFFYFYKTKQMVLLAITLTLVLRSMTDKFIFGEYGMPIVLYLLLYPYIYRNKRMNPQKQFSS